MKPTSDLTGQTFNYLTVIGKADVPPGKGQLWLCRCKCGKTVTARYYDLRTGTVKSCGCYSRFSKGDNIVDLTGKQFGRLTALYRTDKKAGNCYMWHCKCECGNEVDVSSNSLTQGGTQSCGCLFHKELAGKRFGRLIALYKTDMRKGSNVVWHCKCDCGNECDVPSSSLLQGTTQSCGCLRIDAVKEANTKWHTPEEKILVDGVLHSMKQRCLNPNDDNYHNYGARGIYVCQEWLDNPHSFIDWALSHGYKMDSGLSIERINNDGPYSPDNCKWTNMKEQSNNRRSNRLITIDGISRTISAWAEYAKIDPDDLWGETDEKILRLLSPFIMNRRLTPIPTDIKTDTLRSIQQFVVDQQLTKDPFFSFAFGLNHN